MVVQNGEIEVNGHMLLIDHVGSAKYTIQYEGYEMGLLKKFLHEGDVAIDIGAHVGCYTTIAADMVGPTGKVIAFEPSPMVFDVLRQNMERNGFSNVILEKAAVSNVSGKQLLYICHNNTCDSRIIDWEDGWEAIEVNSIRLDEYLTSSKVALIKMDIQGAEPLAMLGMVGILTHNPDIRILTEYWPYAMEKAGVQIEQYLDGLSALGYRVWVIDENHGRLLETTYDEVSHYSMDRNFYTNLMFARENKEE